MAARVIQELQGVVNGGQQILVRIWLDPTSGSSRPVEVTALVHVPKVESNDQMETAARGQAKRALQEALAAFP